MGGGASQNIPVKSEGVISKALQPAWKESTKHVWSLGVGSVLSSQKVDREQAIDATLTKVPTYDDTNPFDSKFAIQSKLGR